jgi:hypothetical protein
MGEVGYLSAKKFEVYNQLAFYGPKADFELDKLYGQHAHKRRADLMRLGLVSKCGTTINPESGQVVDKWHITAQGEIPDLIPKKPTRAQLLAKITALESGMDSSTLYDSAYAKGYLDILSRFTPVPGDGGLKERIAQLTAHRACHNQEQDLPNGKVAGYCIVCGVPWPCQYSGPHPAQENKEMK